MIAFFGTVVLSYAGGLPVTLNYSGRIDFVARGNSASAQAFGTWTQYTVDEAPPGSQLVAAWLFWTSGIYNYYPGVISDIGFQATYIPYSVLTSDTTFYANYMYVMVKNITGLVGDSINQVYQCEKRDNTNGFSWCVLLVYRNSSFPDRNMEVHYGILDLGYTDVISYYDTIPLINPSTPPWGKFGYFSNLGDPMETHTGEYIQFKGAYLQNTYNPWDNIGNGTLYDPFTGDYATMLYPDGPADIDIYDVSSLFLATDTYVPLVIFGPSNEWLFYAFIAFLYNTEMPIALEEDAGEREPSLVAKPGKLSLDLPSESAVNLKLYDGAGRTVALLHDGQLGPGAHEFAIPRGLRGVGFAVARVGKRTLRAKIF